MIDITVFFFCTVSENREKKIRKKIVNSESQIRRLVDRLMLLKQKMNNQRIKKVPILCSFYVNLLFCVNDRTNLFLLQQAKPLQKWQTSTNGARGLFFGSVDRCRRWHNWLVMFISFSMNFIGPDTRHSAQDTFGGFIGHLMKGLQLNGFTALPSRGPILFVVCCCWFWFLFV